MMSARDFLLPLLLVAGCAGQTLASLNTSVNNLFVFVAAILVFFMHVGFSMLEGSAVQEKNRTAILMKNAALLGVSALGWWSIGYMVTGTGSPATGASIAGSPPGNSFIGTQEGGAGTSAFLANTDQTDGNYLGWFFGWVFSLTAATIVSGCVAERFTLKAYLIFAFCITVWIYPVVVAWCWRENGWLNKGGNAEDTTQGFIDFAGSGVVHMVGGCCGLVAAWLVGPRKYLDDGKGGTRPRFSEDGKVNAASMNSSSGVFAILGTLILWFGWFGFNAGTTVAISNSEDKGTVGLIVVNTVLAPAGAAFTYVVVSMLLGSTDLTGILNCILTGLVGITACCHIVQPWSAWVIGMFAAPTYVGASMLLKRLKIDDPLDAAPVHFFGGMYSLLMTGLLASNTTGNDPHIYGWWTGDNGLLFGWQLCGIVSITVWSAAMSFVVLLPMHFMGMLRMSEEEEQLGLDALWAMHNTMSLSGCPPSPQGGMRPTPDMSVTTAKTADGPNEVQLQMDTVDTETRYCS